MQTPKYKILYTPPPIIERAREAFGIKWEEKNVVMVYGDTIHQSFDYPMDDDLLIHELVHVRQHAEYPGGASAWWDRYLIDAEFRLSQELEAYRIQWQWVLKNEKNRQTRFLILRHCASDLSGSMYGNLMGFTEAMQRIKA